MPASFPPQDRCGAAGSGWLNGGHPTVEDGKVTTQTRSAFTGIQTVVGNPPTLK